MRQKIMLVNLVLFPYGMFHIAITRLWKFCTQDSAGDLSPQYLCRTTSNRKHSRITHVTFSSELS
jgi:hypothetical protein